MDLETAQKLIEKYTARHAEYVRNAEIAERYYRNETDILFRKKSEQTEGGNPLRNADNRIPRNFHGLIVNQKAAYAFTIPPVFDIGNTASNKKVTELLGDEFTKNCMELCVNAANMCAGWVHYWVDETGIEWAVVDSKQITPVFDKSLKKKLIGVLREYPVFLDDGEEYKVYEYWTDKECQAFRKKAADTIQEGLAYCHMFVDGDTGEELDRYRHEFDEVPFIPFWNNNIHTDDLKNIKPLIDVYDKVFSGFINDLEDIQELIFVISGYGGTDLDGFLQDLKKYKVIRVDSSEGSPGVSTINIEIPIEARNSVLEATRKAIFEQGQGFDPRPENFGNQSGEALKFMYSLLEMKTGLMETEFRLGFARLIRALCKYAGISCDVITQTWKRTRIKNETEQAQICRDSIGIISRKTILKNHPFVENVDEELKQLQKEEKEEQEKAELYQNAFSGKDKNEKEENSDTKDQLQQLRYFVEKVY